MGAIAPPGRDAAACNKPTSRIRSKKSLQKTAITGSTPSPSYPLPWLPRGHKHQRELLLAHQPHPGRRGASHPAHSALSPPPLSALAPPLPPRRRGTARLASARVWPGCPRLGGPPALRAAPPSACNLSARAPPGRRPPPDGHASARALRRTAAPLTHCYRPLAAPHPSPGPGPPRLMASTLTSALRGCGACGTASPGQASAPVGCCPRRNQASPYGSGPCATTGRCLVSDGPLSSRGAVAEVCPAVPHPLVTSRRSREAAPPMDDAARHAKHARKKRVRGGSPSRTAPRRTAWA